MKNLLFTFIVILLSMSFVFGQCINNPSIQQGDINPAPLVNGAGGILTLSYVENLLDYTDEETDPITLTICLLNIVPVSGAGSVSGSFSGTFNWLYDASSNCFQGTQNQDILGGAGGQITIAFNQSSPVLCPSNQMGYNANLQPAACMNGINETVDDTESVYTCAVAFVPIELSEFFGYSKNCKGLLEWTTQSEVDFSHFELEKSINGETFQTIATIKGKGSEIESTSYSYVDLQLRDINLYRLKSVDLDGSVSYSKLISLTRDGCSAQDGGFAVFPNPAYNNSINVQLNSTVESNDATIVFTDVLGRVLMEVPIAVAFGINNFDVDIDKLADATYFIGFRGVEAIKETKKFVKLSN